MAVLGIGSVGVSNVAGSGQPKAPAKGFSQALEAAKSPARHKPAGVAQQHHQHQKQLVNKVEAKATIEVTAQRPAARALDQVSAAQTRMEKVLELAQSG